MSYVCKNCSGRRPVTPFVRVHTVRSHVETCAMVALFWPHRWVLGVGWGWDASCPLSVRPRRVRVLSPAGRLVTTWTWCGFYVSAHNWYQEQDWNKVTDQADNKKE